MSTPKTKTTRPTPHITYTPPQPMFGVCPDCGLVVLVQVASSQDVQTAEGVSGRMPVYLPQDPPLNPVLGEVHRCGTTQAP
jgi:hypothetical protein